MPSAERASLHFRSKRATEILIRNPVELLTQYCTAFPQAAIQKLPKYVRLPLYYKFS